MKEHRNENNELHRIDGPAIEWANGDKYWYQNDELHRIDGPAVDCVSGTKYWFQNGKLHRLDGPAVEQADGHKEWWQNGKFHRLDGPAVEWVNGTKEWYVEGEELTEQEFRSRTQTDVIDLKQECNLTESLESMGIGCLRVIKHKDKVYLGFKESSTNLRVWESSLLLIDKEVGL